MANNLVFAGLFLIGALILSLLGIVPLALIAGVIGFYFFAKDLIKGL